MRSCPECGNPYSREIRTSNDTESTTKFIHAGYDCVISIQKTTPMDVATRTIHELEAMLKEAQQELEKERMLRQEAEQRVQLIAKIALNQNYLEENRNEEALNRFRAGGWIGRRSTGNTTGDSERITQAEHGYADSGANKD